MSDVAAIQAAFRGIEDSRALLLAVFVHTPLGMALYDSDGWAIADNPAHRAMFGPRPPGRYNLLQDPRVDASGQRRLIERGLAGEAVTLPPYVSTNRVDGRPLQVTQSSWFPVRGADGELEAVARASRDTRAEEMQARGADELGPLTDSGILGVLHWDHAVRGVRRPGGDGSEPAGRAGSGRQLTAGPGAGSPWRTGALPGK